MSTTISLVQRVHIASPCPASWESMVGDDRVRFCGQCKLNVYNLSAMTEEEGTRLIVHKEGKLCAAIYRRADGTILTKDCPVGLRLLRQHAAHCVARVAAAIALLSCAALYATSIDRHRDRFDRSAYKQTVHTIQRWLEGVPPPPPPGMRTPGSVMILPPPNSANPLGDAES